LRSEAKFCDKCGAPVAGPANAAEYKQVTVLFADVVHSMDIASALGAERLREIMSELVSRSAAVVQRYGGIVDKFTGDGIMALFGAPVALEDHALRACLAALGIQEQVKHFAVGVKAKDGVALRLRIGLNSGEVIAGEISPGPSEYTAIGTHVGMAQRMESVAAPGGVTVSESTARLVKDTALLDEPELVRIKGAADPVPACTLLGVAASRGRIGPHASTLVGRDWELAALTAMLDKSVDGYGGVAGIVGPPGIGKSRIVAETTAYAKNIGVQVFSTYCESHSSEIAFHAVTRLLRAVLGIEGVDDEVARALVRTQLPDADFADLVLLDDLLGIHDATAGLPEIAPDARRRRLIALLNTAALSRLTPRVYVIEDGHWIDQASEAMVAEFLAVIPRTHSLVLITYRPEYRGALGRIPSAQTISLTPLADSQLAALTEELLGSQRSVAGLADRISETAAGNPFFAEQIVCDLADRGVLTGERGAYHCGGEVGELQVPANLHAAIASRIDRLDASAKHTLNAASVIGLRFPEELLASVIDTAAVTTLLEAELIDQVAFTPRAEYGFRHPLIRTVAYESQLRSDRAQLHRKLAAAIEQNDENGPLIAEHLEAAGDLREAYDWHMRAGTWLRAYRDIGAAWTSWRRARHIADRLPVDDPARTVMRIAPRARLCATAWRAGCPVAETGFDELRDMAVAAGDEVSLAIGIAGQINALCDKERYREASQLASELEPLLDSIGDPTLTVALLWSGLSPKMCIGEIADGLRLSQRVIDLADGNPHAGDLIIETPLLFAQVLRAGARACSGQPGWKQDMELSAAVFREINPGGRPILEMVYLYRAGILHGLMQFDEMMLDDAVDTLKRAEQRGDDYALIAARVLYGLLLIRVAGPQRDEGFRLLAEARKTLSEKQLLMYLLPIIDLETAKQKARNGDHEGAIEILRGVLEHEFSASDILHRGTAVSALVETLLERGTERDVMEAETSINRLAAVPVEPGFVVYDVELLRLRALLARARGDEAAYRDFADTYGEMATSLGFEGHMAMAAAM
jgi:adenylate cyclase